MDRLFYVSDMLEALPGKDALILLTEWRQFRQMEWTLLGDLLKRKIVFDGRNIYDPIAAKAAGFEYYCIGRGCILGDYVNGSVKE